MWSLSRPLVYRAVDHLEAMGLVAPLGVQQIGRSAAHVAHRDANRHAARSIDGWAFRSTTSATSAPSCCSSSCCANDAASISRRWSRHSSAGSGVTLARLERATARTSSRCGEPSQRLRCAGFSTLSKRRRRSVSPAAEAAAPAAATSRWGCGSAPRADPGSDRPLAASSRVPPATSRSRYAPVSVASPKRSSSVRWRRSSRLWRSSSSLRPDPRSPTARCAACS